MEDEIANAEVAIPVHSGEGEGGAAESAPDPLAEAVSRYRDLVASQPGLVPEMIHGSTIEEIDTSAQAARQAYHEVTRRIAAAHEAQIPAGNPARSQMDAHTSTLKPEAKIALGLQGK